MALHEFLILFGAALLMVAMHWRDHEKASLPPLPPEHHCAPLDVQLLTPALEQVRHDYTRRLRARPNDRATHARLLSSARASVAALPFFCSLRPEGAQPEEKQHAIR